jgi:hypothetical protein
VKEALKKKEDLCIYFDDKRMVIKYEDLRSRILDRSGITYSRPYVNNGEPYELYFFLWQPMSKESEDREFLGY